MPNNPIAELIAAKLKEGIVHPGDGKDIPPAAVLLPEFRGAGLHKEEADLRNAIAKTLSEAIVHTIESDGDSAIIAKNELAALRTEVASVADVAPHRISVHCQCDRNRQNPLLLLATRGQQTVVIDEKQVRMLLSRSPQCPHEGKQ